MKRLVLLTATLLALPSLALAFSFPPGFYLKGRVGYEFLDDAGSDVRLGYGKLTLGYLSPAEVVSSAFSAASGIPWGVRLDMQWWDVSTWSSSRDIDVMPWVHIGDRANRFSFGATPILVDSYINYPGILPGYLSNRLAYGELFSPASNFRFQEGNKALSLRYDKEIDNFRVGLAYSRLEGTSSDADVFSLGLKYATPTLRVGFAYERLNAPTTTIDYAAVSGKVRFDKLTLSAFAATETSSGGTTFNSISVGADYRLSDRFKIGVDYLHAESGSSSVNATSIMGRYKFDNGIGIYAGASRQGSNDTYSIGIDYKFAFGDAPRRGDAFRSTAGRIY